MSTEKIEIGPVLVTGGAGCIGSHIVQALLEDGVSSIIVTSRNPVMDLAGVKCIAGDFTDQIFIKDLIVEHKPQVIIHAAAPRATADIEDNEFFRINVDGTKQLLQIAEESPTTQVFIYTSTVNVIQGFEHINAKEDSQPYWTRECRAIPYWKSKAETEQVVLDANSERLKTVALRPCFTTGIRDFGMIPAQLDALDAGRTSVQLGDGKNELAVVTAANVATAHILAMHALLDSSKANVKVAGEAFNVANDFTIPWWDFCRLIWRTGGDTRDPKNVTVIPKWAANVLAYASEAIYKTFLGPEKKPVLTKLIVQFTTLSNTYDCSKAKNILGYAPVQNVEETIVLATRWEMERRRKEKESATT